MSLQAIVQAGLDEDWRLYYRLCWMEPAIRPYLYPAVVRGLVRWLG